MQKIGLSLFFPDLKAYLDLHHISLIRYLAFEHYEGVFIFVFLAFFSVSFICLARVIFNFRVLKQKLKGLQTTIYHESLDIKELDIFLSNRNIKILITNQILVPMAVYNNTLLIPEHILKDFSKEELYSIIAHEAEHLKCKDPYFRFLLQMIASFFYWIPTGFLIKKINLDQELACDASLSKYGLQDKALANALIKVAVTTKMHSHPSLCYLNNTSHSLVIRLHSLLGVSINTCSSGRFLLFGWMVLLFGWGACLVF